MKGEPIVILLVEDEEAHAEIIRRNLEESRLGNNLVHLTDGQMALDYLYRRNDFLDPATSPRPGLILLDLRLPKVDGLEVLRTLKTDEHLRSIPVVILTTSKAESDLVQAYEHHANSYLVKPVDFSKFTQLMETFGYYWLAWNQYPC